MGRFEKFLIESERPIRIESNANLEASQVPIGKGKGKDRDTCNSASYMST